MSVSGEWQEAFEENVRWLLVSEAPPLSGETALAVVELLWAVADTIDSAYAAEIEQHRRRRSPVGRERWWPGCPAAEPERQLRLELGDEDYF